MITLGTAGSSRIYCLFYSHFNGSINFINQVHSKVPRFNLEVNLNVDFYILFQMYDYLQTHNIDYFQEAVNISAHEDKLHYIPAILVQS